MELQKIVTVYLARVLALTEIDKDTYQLMMLCKDYQGMLELTFGFRQLDKERGLEQWLTKCLGFKISFDK